MYFSLFKTPVNVILLCPLFLGDKYFVDFQEKFSLLFLLTNVLRFQMGVFCWLIYHYQLLPHYVLVILQNSFVSFLSKSSIILYEPFFCFALPVICLFCGSGLAWSVMPSRKIPSLFWILGNFSFPVKHSSRQQVFSPKPDPVLPKLPKG